MSADAYLHAFRTFMGLPPEKGDRPACGAAITDAYDFAGGHREPCPACAALMAEVSA